MKELEGLVLRDRFIFKEDKVLLRNGKLVSSLLVTTTFICLKNFLDSKEISSHRRRNWEVGPELFCLAKKYFLEICLGQRKAKWLPKKIKKTWREFKLADERGEIPEDIKNIVLSVIKEYSGYMVIFGEPRFYFKKEEFPVLSKILKDRGQ